MMRQERDYMQAELKTMEREKTFEIRELKREFEDRIRQLEFDNKRLNKENQILTAELDAQDSYIGQDRTNEEIKRVYEDCEKQTERLEIKLKETDKKYRDMKAEFEECREANDYLKQVIEDKEEYIQELEIRAADLERKHIPQTKVEYRPMPESVSKPKDNFEVENLKRRLKLTEEENERLREQAYKADKEVERLKENIIQNVKKNFGNKENSKDDKPKDEKFRLTDFALSIETNPNLVNEMAKMSGASAFKYGLKGPYDESLEKLRKEFSIQQKELGFETLSELSLEKRDNGYKSPEYRTYALMMGESNLSPTGDLKVDYSAVVEENKQLKLIVKEMRKEMEMVVKKLNEKQSDNRNLSPYKEKEGYGYLSSNNLQLLEKQQEIDKLKEELRQLKSQRVSAEKPSSDRTIAQLEKKLEEKREIIAKLREERDNLLQICSEMKIQINSMKKMQEFQSTEPPTSSENMNFTNIVTRTGRNVQVIEPANSKGSNIECVKSRLDTLGEHVQELFNEFKTALHQNKRSGSALNWKRPSIANKKEITVSGAHCNKLLEKFEKIQQEISAEKEGISLRHKRKLSRNSSKKRKLKNKSKSPIKAFAIKLAERNFGQQKASRQSLTRTTTN